MVKCIKCGKVVSKKNPGVQCSKCNKWQHGTCASLSVDQLSALSATDSVDWKCKTCSGGGKPKRVSCILPDPEEESDYETGTPGLTELEKGKILIAIRQEVRDVIREELQSTLEFFSTKIDEYETKIQQYEDKIKSIENQCIDIRNSYKNLVLKNEVLEQKVNKMEQSQSSNELEICGITETENEDIKNIVVTVCKLLNQNPEDIIKASRKKKHARGNTAQGARARASAPIIVSLREGGRRDQWLAAARAAAIRACDLGGEGDSKVYLRESLTPSTAFLLWKSKVELKEKSLCKYVWCRNGVIKVRKTDGDSKIYVVRSISDVERIAKELQG